MENIKLGTTDIAASRTPCARRREVRAIQLRVIVHAISTLALVAGSVAAIADQSEKFTGAHEIVGIQTLPRFVSDRVELPPGIATDSPANVRR